MSDSSMLASGGHIPPPKAVDDPLVTQWLARIIVVLILLGLLSAFVEKANSPADPFIAEAGNGVTSSQASLPSRGAHAPFEAFAETSFTITAAQVKEAEERCALLADSVVLQSKGLMEQSDLAGYVGMIFKFETESSGTFFMRNTRIPLSIAFFDSDGAFVSSADMEPCPDEITDCPTYAADRPYRYALEVPKGELAAIGAGAGSTLALAGSGCSG
ncbi:MAG: DUF192 domain-containing protein [Acidimicrobiales bacterium]